MLSERQAPSGYRRAEVHRKGQYVSRSFRPKADAEAWAISTEQAIENGKSAIAPKIDAKSTFGTLIELRIADLADNFGVTDWSPGDQTPDVAKMLLRRNSSTHSAIRPTAISICFSVSDEYPKSKKRSASILNE